MAQSTLYKYGDSTAQTVDVTSDGSRDLGVVDVAQFSDALDISDRSNRDLGSVDIANAVSTTGTTEVDIVAQTLGQIATDIAAALGTNATDHLLVESDNPLDASAAPVPVEDNNGAQINPATEETVSSVQSALGNRSSMDYGRDSISTAGTPVALNGGTSATVADGCAVAIQALYGNTGEVYVGDSSVDSATGYPLQPGQVLTLQMDDVASIYVDAANGGDGVSWVVEAN